MPFIGNFHKAMIRIHHRDRLAPPPRTLANLRTSGFTTPEDGRVYARSRGRSPENVKNLLRQYEVSSVDELIPLLPAYRPRINFRRRVKWWIRHLFGLTTYDVPAARHYSDLKQRGRAPGINRELQ